jgi:hypothetical protein
MTRLGYGAGRCITGSVAADSIPERRHEARDSFRNLSVSHEGGGRSAAATAGGSGQLKTTWSLTARGLNCAVISPRAPGSDDVQSTVLEQLDAALA